jgi:hypothetical protein
VNLSSRRRHLYVLSATLAFVGLSVWIYRATELGFPMTPNSTSPLWTVEARIQFERFTPGPAKAMLVIPSNPLGYEVLTENFISRGYGVSVSDEDDDRVALWAIRRTEGEQSLYYRMRVFRRSESRTEVPPPPFPPVPELEEPFSSAMDAIIEDVRRQSADVETFTATLLQLIASASPNDNVRLFIGHEPDAFAAAEAARTLLSGARIPARVLQVIPLPDEARRVEMEPWIAVHNGKRWLFFNPTTGIKELPKSLLIWRWNGDPIARVSGGVKESVEFRVSPSVQDALSLAQQQASSHGSRLAQFSLLDLPLKTQQVYAVVLLIPIGALVIVLMRNVIGVRTFGTFLPVLVALAFRETQLVAGILLFSTLVALGLALRLYLERLHLLLVPRLAAVLTMVVLLMAALSVLSHRLGLETGLSVALFPMVILTMTIERMSVVWEERGPRDAIIDGLGSLLVATIAYGVMSVAFVQHLVFVFPETLLVVLAVILMLGSYTGYRLTEIRRFRALGGHRT